MKWECWALYLRPKGWVGGGIFQLLWEGTRVTMALEKAFPWFSDIPWHLLRQDNPKIFAFQVWLFQTGEEIGVST